MERKLYTILVPSVDSTVFGRVLNNPTLRNTKNNNPVIDMRVMFTRSWQDPSTKQWQNKEKTIKVICWRKLAEQVAEMDIHPGDVIGAIINLADLEIESWEKDGTQNMQISATATRVYVVGRGENRIGNHSEEYSTYQPIANYIFD